MSLGNGVPAKGFIHHLDLAVTDVERSLSFYDDLLTPLGWTKRVRYPTYRGSEEVVYLQHPATLGPERLDPTGGLCWAPEERKAGGRPL